MHVLIPPTSCFSKFWGFLGSIWGFCCISCFQRNWQVWANIWDPKRPKQVINSEFIVYFLCHTMNLVFLIPQVSLRILAHLNFMICYLNVEFRSLNLCVFGCLNNPLRVPQGSPKTGRDGWGKPALFRGYHARDFVVPCPTTWWLDMGPQSPMSDHCNVYSLELYFLGCLTPHPSTYLGDV